MPFLKVADLPSAVRDQLSHLGMRAGAVRVELAESVRVSDAGEKGRQAFACQCDNIEAKINAWGITLGSWGGPNPFSPKGNDVDDLRSPPRALTRSTVLILGSKGEKTTATVYFHPETIVAGVIDALARTEAPCVVHTDCREHGMGSTCKPSAIDARAQNVLAVHRGIKAGKYRKEALARMKVSRAEIDALVSSGHLTRSKSDAVTITTKGRNACEGIYVWDGK